MTEKCEQVSELLKNIAHPAKLKILCSVSTGQKSVGELEKSIGISQSAMSQHLKAIWKSDLLKREKVGQSVYYAIKEERVLLLIKSLHDLFCKQETL